MKKFFIKNRQGKKISVSLEKNNNQAGLVFIMPGLGATKKDTHVRTFAKAFREKDFTVVIFDVTNGVGESDGDYSQASFTGYYNDLSDVIDWSRSQNWYQELFCLVGHSMGGGCVLWYGANHPEKLSGLAPISTVIGGHQTLAKFNRDSLAVIKKDENNQDVIKKLDWKPFEKDILQYDIVPEATKMTMPILMMVGDQDPGTPLEDQMKFYKGVPGEKEMHVIKGAAHTFEEPIHLKQVRQIFKDWIDNKVLK